MCRCNYYPTVLVAAIVFVSCVLCVTVSFFFLFFLCRSESVSLRAFLHIYWAGWIVVSKKYKTRGYNGPWPCSLLSVVHQSLFLCSVALLDVTLPLAHSSLYLSCISARLWSSCVSYFWIGTDCLFVHFFLLSFLSNHSLIYSTVWNCSVACNSRNRMLSSICLPELVFEAWRCN